MTDFTRSATVFVEVAHHGLDGKIHGHSLSVTAVTASLVDLDEWKAELTEACRLFDLDLLEEKVGRTFEDVASAVLRMMQLADSVTVGLPSRLHMVTAIR